LANIVRTPSATVIETTCDELRPLALSADVASGVASIDFRKGFLESCNLRDHSTSHPGPPLRTAGASGIAKMNLIGNGTGPVGLAIIPYVKLPSSVPVISNGVVDGGLIAPLALRLPQDYLVTLMTEVDVVKNSANRREVSDLNIRCVT
jgi:hypothetical protein